MSSSEGDEVVSQIRRLQAVVFCMTVSLLLPCPAYPFYFTQFLQFSSASYGQIVGASSLAHLVAAITYGRISDHIGRKRVMLFQTGLSFFLYLFFAVLVILAGDASSPLRSPIAAVFVLLGFANTVNLLTCSAVCDLCLKTTGPNKLAALRPKFLAQVAGVIALAGVVGPPIGQVVQIASGADTRPHIVLFLAAIASAVAAGVAMTTIETNKFLAPPPSPTNWDTRSETSFRRHAVSPLLPANNPASSFEIIISEARPEPLPRGPHAVSSRATSSGPPSEDSSVDDNGGKSRVRRGGAEEELPDSDEEKPPEEEKPDCDIPPDWMSLSVAYSSQAIKALSLSTVSVCYALVLDEMLPAGWLFGLTSTQVLALGLSMTCIVRVTIQMGFFHEILRFLRGPGYTFLCGCTLLSLGQLFIFVTLRYLPGPMGLLYTDQHNWTALPFVIIHFLAVGGLLSAGISLIEPALTTLIALCVAKHKKYQGISQGLNSASNLVGSTIGPPLFGWILALKKSPTTISGAPIIAPSGVVPPAPLESEMARLLLGVEAGDFHQTASVRPALVFYTAAILAALPLLWSRKILRMSKGWELK